MPFGTKTRQLRKNARSFLTKTSSQSGLRLSALLQERDLLASVLSENPCLAWTKVTSRYCKAALAANLPVRTASSLTHMLARAAETGLQLAKCARMLGLCSSQQTDQLDNLVAADLHLLERLLVHGRQLRKLCSIACEDTFTVLKALPAHVTDEEWTRNLFEQCEIEADVALWHSGLRKAGFRRRSRKEVSVTYTGFATPNNLCNRSKCRRHVSFIMLSMIAMSNQAYAALGHKTAIDSKVAKCPYLGIAVGYPCHLPGGCKTPAIVSRPGLALKWLSPFVCSFSCGIAGMGPI